MDTSVYKKNDQQLKVKIENGREALWQLSLNIFSQLYVELKSNRFDIILNTDGHKNKKFQFKIFQTLDIHIRVRTYSIIFYNFLFLVSFTSDEMVFHWAGPNR